MHRLLLLSLPILLLCGCGNELPPAVEQAYAELPLRIDFNQHVRPILSDRCYSCHGPDAAARQADLRLDTEEGAFAALVSGTGRAIVPGKPGASAIIERLVSSDPDRVMPPPESKLTVSPQEIATLTKWIEQGAEWKGHWAFLPVERPPVPANPGNFPASGPIDHFVNAALHQRHLEPRGRAPEERLLRRLYLDLTGLPPTPEQADSWLADPSEERYAATVDELLASDAHAERLAVEWLDLARYADSHGMHADGARTSYPYRDWVLRALKNNQPFDRFVTEQLAGDLLPEPTQEQRVATAFLRMHPITAEGGAIDEEMRLTYVFDRVNTVSTGLLGLTMDCSRCHDHKFDPLGQAEYYGFSAFFNNFNELGMTGDDGDFGPYMMLADSLTRRRLDAHEARLAQLGRERAAVAVTDDELRAFLQRENVRAPLPDHYIAFDEVRPTEDGQRIDGIAWATKEWGTTRDSDRGRVAEFDHPYDGFYLDEGFGQYRATEPFSGSIFVRTVKRDSTLTQTILGTSGAKNHTWKGQDFYLDEQNRLNFRLLRSLPDDGLHVRTTDSLRTGRWYQVGWTYDGSGRASGIKLFVDGQMPEQRQLLDNLRGSVWPETTEHWLKEKSRKLRLGRSYRAFTGEDGIFLGRMDDLRLWNRALSVMEMQRSMNAGGKPEEDAARHHLLVNKADYRRAHEAWREEKARQLALEDTLVRLMVAEEIPRLRRTYLLDRGAYDAPRQEVFPTTPVAVLPYPEDLRTDRLGLAQWLFDPANPLTARVAVNRYWQLLFGQGLVATPHDFGSQGKLPTHPELLDYLAGEFRDSGWDVRALLRRLVLSETYRRASDPTPTQQEADPDNVWLARGPSGRMPAEMIRDNALAAAGLLNDRVGGPSVKPYQPEGLWIQANNFSQALLRYVPDHGDKLYRRSMYTFNKRTSPPPFMTTFDVPVRDVCHVSRSQTNTPLQALNLLNDPQFVEAARVLAQRVQQEAAAPDEQLDRAFRLVTGRRPTPDEQTILLRLHNEELVRFHSEPALADSLLAVGEYPVPANLNRIETATLASVSNMLLSFDEAYTKR